MRRKGMMVGKGKKGYHNVIGKDPYVHSQSARGIKQPQKVRYIHESMKYGQYKVKAVALDRKTRKQIGKARTETIDSRDNELFKGAKTTKDIEDRYEGFWNDLDPQSEEIIKVISVERKSRIESLKDWNVKAANDSIKEYKTELKRREEPSLTKINKKRVIKYMQDAKKEGDTFEQATESAANYFNIGEDKVIEIYDEKYG